MKKSIYLFSILLISATLVFLFYINTYTEFQPTTFDGNSYNSVNVDKLFYKNLEAVLDYSKIKYKTDGKGKILIKRNLSLNKELLLNYTEKAFDTAWLNSHRKLNSYHAAIRVVLITKF